MMVENMIDKLFEYGTNLESFTINLFISILQIFIFFLLIIGICIHNEIIVINKCRLNEYTKKRIASKGEEDFKEIIELKGVLNDNNLNDDESIKG